VRTFKRGSDGRLVVTFYEGHITLLGVLFTAVRERIASPPPDDAAYARLFPVAYLDPTEESRETEWQDLVHDDLVREKLATFDDLRDVLAQGRPGRRGTIVLELDAAREELLLQRLNDVRLVLGEIIGEGPEAEPAVIRDLPGIGASDILEWLTDLVSQLVECKLDELPDH
jgi:hypothetical protein